MRAPLTPARCLVGLWLLVVVAACASGPGPRGLVPTAGDRFFVSGYHPYWTADAWEDYPFDALDRLYFFEVEAGPDGTIAAPHGWPEEWVGLVERATSAGVDVVPTLSMHGREGFEAVFSSADRSGRLVDAAVGLLRETPSLGGIHLDFEVFEPVAPEARSGFTAFVERLGAELDELDDSYTLSSFVLAFDDDDVYDEPALAERLDYLVVQGYDFHSAGEPNTGPVAPLRGWGRLNWEYVLERFMGFGVPPRKIVMAVPLYGYEWPTESDEPGSTSRAQGVEIVVAPRDDIVPELIRAPLVADTQGLLRDPVSGSPYYVYPAQDGWRQGWFEDAESLRAKYAFVRERGLGGIAIFPLAYGDETLWRDLREAFRLPRE